MRPLVPATMGCALGAAVTAAGLLQAGWEGYLADAVAQLSAGAYGSTLASAAVLAGAAALLGLRWGERARQAMLWLRWGALGVAVASASCALWLGAWDARSAALEGRTLSSCVLVASSDARVSTYGSYVTAKVYDDEGAYLATVRLGTSDVLNKGDSLVAVGAFEALDESSWARSRFFKGEVAVADAAVVLSSTTATSRGLLQGARAAALEAIGPAQSDARALIAGIVCGCTTELNQTGAADDFATCGLSHLVAVSGSHLALISMLLEGVLRRARLRPAARAGTLVFVMACYVVFTGCAASAVRSVCMVAASMLAGLGERRAHPLSGLALTVALLVVLNPGVVYDLGFQLSALSVLFIHVFGRYVAHLLARLRLPQAVAEALSLTLCAQWATLPVTVPVFGSVSLISPLANLLVGPLMSALLVVGMIAVPVAAVLPTLRLVLAPALWLANASIFLARVLAEVPYAAMAADAGTTDLLWLYVCALAVYLLWRDWAPCQLGGALGAVMVACACYLGYWTWFAPASITVLSVGQADCILVRDGSHVLLVDAGVDEEALLALARNHVYRIDAVVITHWDSDHYGGLDEIMDALPVGAVFVAEGAADSVPAAVADDLEGLLGELSCGDAICVGGFTCTMVWPAEEVAGDENEDSLVLKVSYEEEGRTITALLTGDTESEELECYAAAVGDIDFLKVGHHGSKVSVDAASLAVLQPELAVASAGEGNSYGHPTAACISLLEEAGATFLCTIEAGDVTVYPAEDGVRVVTQY